MMTKIYGWSDDVVEIEGAISDELDCYDHKRPIGVTASDGTKATIFYDGSWSIDVKTKGSLFYLKQDKVDDDGNHIGYAEGCTSYSDVLILNAGVEWVKIGRKKFLP